MAAFALTPSPKPCTYADSSLCHTPTTAEVDLLSSMALETASSILLAVPPSMLLILPSSAESAPPEHAVRPSATTERAETATMRACFPNTGTTKPPISLWTQNTESLQCERRLPGSTLRGQGTPPQQTSSDE